MSKPLINEELLKPRFIVIADYPGSEQSNQIGKIYQADECSARWLNEMSHYPHLFRKLSWWEHREESEMPKYLKIGDKVYKIKSWEKYFGWLPHEDIENDNSDFRVKYHFNKGLPATETEYNSQK